MKHLILIAAAFGFTTASAAETVWTSIECMADKGLRQGGGSEVSVDSRLLLRISGPEEQASLDYIGHVRLSYEWSGGGERTDYYAQFLGSKLAQSQSPRARTYPDSEFYRFKDFDAKNTTAHDGGGMWGYLVVSKEYFSGNGSEPFAAHYVFKAGDHMGGTIDYQCNRE